VQTKIRRWDNSLGLKIPRLFAEEAGVGVGSASWLCTRRGPRNRLRELLRQVTSKNLHTHVNTGGPAGREVW
jgi:antitoxin MazE